MPDEYVGMCKAVALQATCDKMELNRKIIRIRKCFDEANDVVCGRKKK